MHGLAVYVKEGFPFAWELSLENSADSYFCFRPALLHSASYFFFLYRSPSSSLRTVFDSKSFNIDEILLINPSANVFVFGDFNVHHKDWLTYSGGTDRPGQVCYNFSISNNLVQIVNFPTRIPDCDSHSPALLDLFLSSDTSICSTMAFPPLVNPDHVVVSVSIDFPINAKQDTDCIPVVVLKNFESELSYVLAKLFNMCLKESCFPDCWKVSSVVPAFKNVGERCTAKIYRPVTLLSVVSKVFEKLANNRIVDHLENCGLFSDFQYGFRSS